MLISRNICSCCSTACAIRAHAPGNHRGGGHWAPTAMGLGQCLQHPHLQCHPQKCTGAASCTWPQLLSDSGQGWAGLGEFWGTTTGQQPQGSSCSWSCAALSCLKSTCYNIRCSLSADHYTRSKSISCPKTELTRSKLILKNINPKTDLRHLSWELALWQLLKTYYTNLISNKQQHSRSLGFSGHLKVYHLNTPLFQTPDREPSPRFYIPTQQLTDVLVSSTLENESRISKYMTSKD